MTTVTATREALAPALARAAAIVPNRTTIPILQCVLLETSGEGLFVSATDMDMTYREKVDASPRQCWRTCVNAARLDAFVAGAPPEAEVALRADDEGRLTILSGRASCRLATLPVEDFPLFIQPNEAAVELTFDAEAFAAGLRAVAPAMADEPARPQLCGAFLHAGRLCATDGHRLTLQTVATDLPLAPDIIVPSPTVTRLLSLLRGQQGPISVTLSQTQIVVRTSSWTLTSKVIDRTFPDYARLVPEPSPHPLLVRREALRNAAALVAKVERGDKGRGLRLAIAAGELLVASSGGDRLAACEVTIPLESEPSALAVPVGLHPHYLLPALDAITAERVELHIADAASPVWVCAAGEAHDGSVIMPMRA